MPTLWLATKVRQEPWLTNATIAVVAEMLKRIRGSPVVHADETGWREDGVNGYVWTFSTPTERYFLRRGRGKGVVDEVLGEFPGQGDGMLFSGVLVSDFYAAYSHYAGLKQRCWVHLLRDIDELEALYPQDTGLGRWDTAVRQLYDRAKASADYPSPPNLTKSRTFTITFNLAL